MATPDDVARAMIDLAEARAKHLDDAPTGVVPGYSAALGGTVLPNGKVRYVQSVMAGGLVGIATRGGSAAVNIAQGASVRLPFGTASFGAVTTGATAYITVPTAAWYRIDVSIGMRGTNGTYVRGDFFDIFIHRQDTNAQLAGNTTFAYANIVPGTYAPFVPINGFVFLNLPAGLGIYLKAENQCSVAGNATAPDGSGDFFAVSYA